jgi:TRAP-type C4-dicarboxylate transport system substrate-binding protein
MQWLKAITLCVMTSCTTLALAQDLPATQLKVIGGLSTRAVYKEVEQPFWLKTVPDKSGGKITAEISAFDEMGLKGQELLRLMKRGIVEFGVVPLSYSVTETPLYEGLDLAGMAPDIKSAKALVKAFTPVLASTLETSQQVKLLGVSPYASQVLFCNVPIRGLNELKGKTVRTVTRSQADLMDALGAKSSSVAMSDILGAFKNKKIDCAVAVPMTAYQAKWYTVATHIYAMPLGWNQEVHAVNQKSWDALEPKVQQFLQTNINELINRLWSFSAEQSQVAYDCLAGDRSCKLEPKGKMVLVRPTASDIAVIKRLATQKVAPKWASRCSAQCVSDFNRSIGVALNITLQK